MVKRKTQGVQWTVVFAWLVGALAVPAAPALAEWNAAEQPDLKQELLTAPMMWELDLDIPIYTVQLGNRTLMPNSDGKTYDVLQWYYKSYAGPFTAVAIDMGTGEIVRHVLPFGQQSRGGQVVGPDGKYYLAAHDGTTGMELTVYDPATNTFDARGVVVPDLLGEAPTYRLVIGTDGMIYGCGTYPQLGKAGAYQVDPATGEVTDYGPLGPSHNPHDAWGYSVGADETHVYVASGKIPWYLIAYDKRSGEHEILIESAPHGEDIQIHQRPDGVLVSYYKGFRGTYEPGTYDERIEYWAHHGELIEKTSDTPPGAESERPWQQRMAGWPDRPQIDGGALMPSRDGRAALRCRAADADEWESIPFQAPVYANRRTTAILELPDGRLFGRSDGYQGNWIYDAQQNQATHLGKIHLSEYTAVLHEDGKVYMSGYPSSPLWVFDPAKPVVHDPSGRAENANPRFIQQLRSYCGVHKMLASASAADGKVYLGGRWYRDGNGGGLAWYDPETGEAGGVSEPLGSYQVHHMTTASEGRYVVLSTVAVADERAGTPQPDSAKLFIFDTDKGEIVREVVPVPGVSGTGHIVGVGGSRVMGYTNHPEHIDRSILYGIDVETGEVSFTKALPYPLPVRQRLFKTGGGMFDFRLGPDGKVWTFVGDVLVRIDPETVRIEPVGQARLGGDLGFTGDDLIMTGSVELRKEPGALKDSE